MKSRIPPASRLTKSQVRIASEYALEEVDRQRAVWMRRFFKLMALALRDPLSPKGHGMGAVNIAKIIQRVSQYAGRFEHNPEFWDEVDYVVVDRMGLPLEREEKGK